MFKVNNADNGKMSLAFYYVFIVNFENISHIVLVFLLLTFFFEQVTVCKVIRLYLTSG